MYSHLDIGVRERYETLLLEAELERRHAWLKQATPSLKKERGLARKLLALFALPQRVTQ